MKRASLYLAKSALVSFSLFVLAIFAQAQAAGEELTEKSIRTMLNDLQLDYSRKKFSNGVRYYIVETKLDEKSYKSQVYLSKNKKYLWIITGLIFLKEDQDIPRDVLVKLLEANYNQSLQAYFSYNPKTRHLRLKTAIYNDGIGEEGLQQAIKESADLCHRMKTLWLPKYWKE